MCNSGGCCVMSTYSVGYMILFDGVGGSADDSAEKQVEGNEDKFIRC